MSNITTQSGIQISKGSLSVQFPLVSQTRTMTGNRVIRNVQAVGTTHEALVVGDLVSAGTAYFTNLDATNFVQIGVEVAATFYPVIKIEAGKTEGPFRIATLSLFAKADTAAVNLDSFITEA